MSNRTTIEPADLLSISQVAGALGVRVRRAHYLVEEGRLAVAIATPLGRLLRRGDVERLAAERDIRRDRLSGL